jgi:hypothetical protein
MLTDKVCRFGHSLHSKLSSVALSGSACPKRPWQSSTYTTGNMREGKTASTADYLYEKDFWYFYNDYISPHPPWVRSHALHQLYYETLLRVGG